MHELDILHALRELSTTDLSDALDRLGIAGQCLGNPATLTLISPGGQGLHHPLCAGQCRAWNGWRLY